jgi:uncharacterized protein
LEQTVRWALRRLNELHFHVAESCNLRCDYCFATSAPNHQNTPMRLMPFDVYRQGIQLAFSASGASEIRVIFHGGEPLLQSLDFYRNAFRAAEEAAAGANKRLVFGMQSNLTLLTDQLACLFAAHRLSLGTSLDGPAYLHDQMRTAHDAVMRGVRKAQDAHIFSGALCVVGHHNFDRMPEVIDFYGKIGINTFLCNIATCVGRGASLLPLSSEQVFRAYKDIFETMLTRGFDVTEKKVLAKVERHIHKRHARVPNELRCDAPFCHGGISMVAVGVDGSIFPCGCAGFGDAMTNFHLGDIRKPERTFELERLIAFHRKPPGYETICRECEARFVCGHGCPAFDLRDQVTAEAVCQANRRFAEYICARPDACGKYREWLVRRGIA